jgi:hypothetical protein
MNASWFDLLAAAAGGGLFATLLDRLWRVIERKLRSGKSARELLDRHLDPILKTADELSGKLRSLAVEDFASLDDFIEAGNDSAAAKQIELANLMYLFAGFWARLAILRKEGIFVELSARKNGERLLGFMRTMESRRVRIVGRSFERLMGESLLRFRRAHWDVLTFGEFTELYWSNISVRRWFEPLESLFADTALPAVRQRILRYGIVLQAFLGTLDPKHKVSNARPGYGNKLSKKTRRDLFYRVFPIYLPFVKDPQAYLEETAK